MLNYIQIPIKLREIEHYLKEMKAKGFSVEVRQKFYSDEVVKYINNNDFEVKAYRVIL